MNMFEEKKKFLGRERKWEEKEEKKEEKKEGKKEEEGKREEKGEGEGEGEEERKKSFIQSGRTLFCYNTCTEYKSIQSNS